MNFDPSSYGVKSTFDLQSDPENSCFFTKTPPEGNLSKMTEILNHMLVIADGKRKTDPLSKSPKSVIVHNSYHSSSKTTRPTYGIGKMTNFQQDELARPVQTLESITYIFSIVVKVLFGYDFSEKSPQDHQALHAKRKEFDRDKSAWKEIKSTFEREKISKMDRAFDKVDNILLSKEKYLQNIHYHRIALIALSVIALVGMLIAKRSWTVLGLGACALNVVLMFTNYISSSETQAKLARELKPFINACRIEPHVNGK